MTLTIWSAWGGGRSYRLNGGSCACAVERNTMAARAAALAVEVEVTSDEKCMVIGLLVNDLLRDPLPNAGV